MWCGGTRDVVGNRAFFLSDRYQRQSAFPGEVRCRSPIDSALRKDAPQLAILEEGDVIVPLAGTREADDRKSANRYQD